MKKIEIAAFLLCVVDMLRSMTEGKPIQFVNELPDNLSPVLADENRVIQVLFNLLHNAAKYTDEGKITIGGYVKEKNVHIMIVDTGIGMDEEMIQNIFNP